jgi:hypothetical protein
MNTQISLGRLITTPKCVFTHPHGDWIQSVV